MGGTQSAQDKIGVGVALDERPRTDFEHVWYHYTDEAGARGINDTSILKASTTGAGGAGIYVTDKPPTSNCKRRIIENNYGAEVPNNAGKADHVCAFTTDGTQWRATCVRDGVYKLTARDGSARDMKVSSNGDFARPKPRPEPKPRPGAEECFPGSAKVCLSSGVSVEMESLQIGDSVLSLSPGGALVVSQVYAWAHADKDASAEFRKICTASGHQLCITDDHLVPTLGMQLVPARNLALKDTVYVQDPEGGGVFQTVVEEISRANMRGLFAPITMAGTIFVDGVAASCYGTLRHHSIFHAAMWPFRLLHRLLPRFSLAAHAHGGMNLKGAHFYIDVLSLLAPLVRFLRI